MWIVYNFTLIMIIILAFTFSSFKILHLNLQYQNFAYPTHWFLHHSTTALWPELLLYSFTVSK